ncbi:hypothetical protein D3C76_1512930 [compost metagenome]
MSHDFPIQHVLSGDRSLRNALVATIKVLALSNTTGLCRIVTESPALGAEPANILKWVAPASELPVEDTGQPLLINHVVTGSVVPMAQHLLVAWRCVQPQPAQAPFKNRMRRRVLVEKVLCTLDKSLRGR